MAKRKSVGATKAEPRLPPTPIVLRSLYLLSGNMCAFPNCEQLLVDASGDFVGEVCHIEAAKPGGPRFNKNMLNEARRAAANLLLLCRNHHKKTDNVAEFSVAELRKMKAAHESLFLNIGEKMAASLVDLTETQRPERARNLKRMNEVLKWDHSDEQLEEMVGDLEEHLETLRKVPLTTRTFLAQVSKRNYKMRKEPVTDNRHGKCRIGTHDVEGAFDLSQKELKRKGEELDQYGLGCIEEHESYGPLRYVVAVYPVNEWPLWFDIAKFCEKTGVKIETFSRDLDFSALDAPA